jgi:hypothetical protein
LGLLFQPRLLFGDLIRFEKCSAKGQEAALQELLKLYQPFARGAALGLQAELTPPLDIFGSTPELCPVTYAYTPEGSTKSVTIIRPLQWVLAFKDQHPERLRELVARQSRSSGQELQACVLHYLAMHMLATRRPGPASILDALRFPLASKPQQEFSGLPFIVMSAPVDSMRPPDALILQSTQISGTATFEEVVDVRMIPPLADPLREQVLSLVHEHAREIGAELGL